MIDLKPAPALGHAPIEIGGVKLTEIDAGPLTSLAPFNGARMPFALPEPNAVIAHDGGHLHWFGRDLYLLQSVRLGDRPMGVAVTDQSDAWAVFVLEGEGMFDVLARLVPIDLRPCAFPTGRSTRTLIGHMHAGIAKLQDDQFQLMVFRSMAATLWHELKVAMESVAARP